MGLVVGWAVALGCGFELTGFEEGFTVVVVAEMEFVNEYVDA